MIERKAQDARSFRSMKGRGEWGLLMLLLFRLAAEGQRIGTLRYLTYGNGWEGGVQGPIRHTQIE